MSKLFDQKSYDGKAPSLELKNISTLGTNVFIGQESGNRTDVVGNNVFLGTRAGAENTVGRDNCFIGSESGLKNIGGSQNVFIGKESGKNNVSGSNNCFIGTKSGENNKAGSNNVFIGQEAGNRNEFGNQNVFLGNKSGSNNVNGHKNVFLGVETGNKNINGNENVFIGNETGSNNSEGSKNTFLGKGAGAKNKFGSQNTFIGVDSGYENVNGNNNVFLGTFSGKESTGNDNVFLGTNIGNKNNGSNNISLGNISAEQNINGSENVLLGSNSSLNLNGSKNIVCGTNSLKQSSNCFQSILLGNESFTNHGGNSNVCIGNTSCTNLGKNYSSQIIKDFEYLVNEDFELSFEYLGLTNFIKDESNIKNEKSNRLSSINVTTLSPVSDVKQLSIDLSIKTLSQESEWSITATLTTFYVDGNNNLIDIRPTDFLFDFYDYSDYENALIYVNYPDSDVQGAVNEYNLLIFQFIPEVNESEIIVNHLRISSGKDNHIGPNEEIYTDINYSSNNVIIGNENAKIMQKNYQNVIVGNKSAVNAIGDKNVIFGTNCGKEYIGNNNVLFGNNVCEKSKNIEDNVLIGNDAGVSLNGSNNVSLGINTLNEANTNNTICIGNNVGTKIKNDENVLIGNNTGVNMKYGIQNVFIGSEIGNSNNGSKNIFVGYKSGNNIHKNVSVNEIGDYQTLYDLSSNTESYEISPVYTFIDIIINQDTYELSLDTFIYGNMSYAKLENDKIILKFKAVKQRYQIDTEYYLTAENTLYLLNSIIFEFDLPSDDDIKQLSFIFEIPTLENVKINGRCVILDLDNLQSVYTNENLAAGINFFEYSNFGKSSRYAIIIGIDVEFDKNFIEDDEFILNLESIDFTISKLLLTSGNSVHSYNKTTLLNDYSIEYLNSDSVSNNNIFLGTYAGSRSIVSNNNLLFGNYSGNNVSGNNNLLIGNHCGKESNSDNILIGSNITNDKSNCIGIGPNISLSSNYELNIGNLLKGNLDKKSVSVEGQFIIPTGTDIERPSEPLEGSLRYNTQHNKLEIYIDSEWKQV